MVQSKIRYGEVKYMLCRSEMNQSQDAINVAPGEGTFFLMRESDPERSTVKENVCGIGREA